MAQTKAQLIDGKSATIEFSGGSSSAPTITFTGDTNTGIYSPGADQVAISTNGSGRLFVDSSGRVGIGTSSVSGLLHVRGDMINSYGLRLASTYGTGREYGFYFTGLNSDNFQIKDITANADRLVIDSSGRVGIGTTSPGDNLQINQTASNSTTGITLSNTTESEGGGSAITFRAAYGAPGSANNLIARISSFVTSVTGAKQGNIAFETGSFNSISERARIDSSGRLLVGTSSARSNIYNASYTPIVQIETSGALTDRTLNLAYNNGGNTGGAVLNFTTSRGSTAGSNTLVAANDELGGVNFTGTDGTRPIAAASISAYVDGTPGNLDMPGRLVFSTTLDGQSSPLERMRITNDGAILFGTTNADPVANNVNGVAIGSDNIIRCAVSGNPAAAFSRRTSDGSVINFHRGSATIVGTISVTTTATAYNTSSDYRLKENVTAVVDGISRLQQLKPSRFNFIADPDKTVDGFLAHEVQEVVPEAITGEKDAIDEKGNPVYQGIDQSKLVPLLTAALQELVTEVENLKAEVAALKAQ